MYLASAGSCGMDGLFLAIGMNISGHYKILQKRAETLNFDAQIDQELENLIKYHKKIIECSELLIKNYKVVLVAQFMFSSLNICVLGFTIVTVRFSSTLKFNEDFDVISNFFKFLPKLLTFSLKILA